MFALSPTESRYRMTMPIPVVQVIEKTLAHARFAPGKRIALIQGDGVRPELANAFAERVFDKTAQVSHFHHSDTRVGGYVDAEAFHPERADIQMVPGDDLDEDPVQEAYLPAPHLIGDFDCVITLNYRERDRTCAGIFAGYNGPPPENLEWDDDACD